MIILSCRTLLPVEQPSWCGNQCVHFESCPHFIREVGCFPLLQVSDTTWWKHTGNRLRLYIVIIISCCSHPLIVNMYIFSQHFQVGDMVDMYEDAHSKYEAVVEHMKECVCDR